MKKTIIIETNCEMTNGDIADAILTSDHAGIESVSVIEDDSKANLIAALRDELSYFAYDNGIPNYRIRDIIARYEDL